MLTQYNGKPKVVIMAATPEELKQLKITNSAIIIPIEYFDRICELGLFNACNVYFDCELNIINKKENNVTESTTTL